MIRQSFYLSGNKLAYLHLTQCPLVLSLKNNSQFNILSPGLSEQWLHYIRSKVVCNMLLMSSCVEYLTHHETKYIFIPLATFNYMSYAVRFALYFLVAVSWIQGRPLILLASCSPAELQLRALFTGSLFFF